MSYYDDASLMFLAGGGAQKDGTAYSVKPVPVYGAELVTSWTNKDFSAFTSSGSTITQMVSSGSGNNCYSLATFESGKTYKLEFTSSRSLPTNTAQIRISNNDNLTGASVVLNNLIAGLNSVTFIASANYSYIGFYAPTSFTDTQIDGFSIKEVLVVNGDFTFSRGSNLAATRVGAGPNYYIEKGRENLLLQSNTFSNASWLKEVGASVTSGQSGYDGSNDGWELETNGSTFSRLRQTLSTSGVQTFSLYAKAGTLNWLALYSDTASAWFDLTNGVTGNIAASVISTSITSVGSDWYRCSVTYNNSISDVRIYFTNANGTFPTPAGNIYIQSAQLEVGLAATEVIESGATRGTAGILEDTPRFNYSFGASCPSLLLEPSRTNLIGYSEYLGGFFDVSKGVINYNATTAPDGTNSAGKYIVNNGESANSPLTAYITLSPNTDYTLSLFVKKADYNTANIRIYSVETGFSTNNFDLSNGTATADQIEDYGNGWYRIWTTLTTAASVTNSQIQLIRNAELIDGTSGIYIYGAQIEASSYVSSYIPNHSGGTITRAADVCGDAGDASTFNDSEGVLYVESSALANDGTRRMISLSDTSTNNHIRIYPTTTDNNITIAIKSGNVNQYVYNYNGLSNITDTWKVAVKYKANDFATFVNGTKVNSSTSGSTPIGLNSLYFNSGSGGNPFYGKTKQVLVFNTALSDADLAALTTI